MAGIMISLLEGFDTPQVSLLEKKKEEKKEKSKQPSRTSCIPSIVLSPFTPTGGQQLPKSH
jgi:hypothetical protein